MDWSDGCERYLAEWYGETIYDPAEAPEAEEEGPEPSSPAGPEKTA
jgi:hypothetical protein